jgi:hypothetical protein
MKSVTVFFQRRRAVFVAETLTHDAVGLTPAEACRRCAAAHLGVAERWVDVRPAGVASMLARVRAPFDPRKRALWILGLGALFFAGLFAWLYFTGGKP